MTNTTNPALYIGTYKKYNNGSIAGKWFNLNDYTNISELYEALKEVHKDEEDPEYMIQDFDELPKSLYSESFDSNLVEKCIEYANLSQDDQKIVTAYDEATGNTKDMELQDIIENLYCTLESYEHELNEKFGYYQVDAGLIEVPEDIEYYFDYEAYGRDLLMDFDYYVTENGEAFIFTEQ